MQIIVVIAAAIVFWVAPAAADRPQKDNPWFKAARQAVQAQKARKSITPKARNVILFVSDGNGIGTNYATRLFMGQKALIPLHRETHSGEDVAIYARRPWAHLFDGTVEQNDVFHVMHFAVQGE